MGIAVLSGVLDSMDPQPTKKAAAKWDSHTPGTLTPQTDLSSEPSHFVACVKREENVIKLRSIFGGLGRLGSMVEVVASGNLEAVTKADVVLLWFVSLREVLCP